MEMMTLSHALFGIVILATLIAVYLISKHLRNQSGSDSLNHLRGSSIDYKNGYDNWPDPVIVYNAQGRALHRNKVARRLKLTKKLKRNEMAGHFGTLGESEELEVNIENKTYIASKNFLNQQARDKSDYFIRFTDVTQRVEREQQVRKERDLFVKGPVITLSWCVLDRRFVKQISSNVSNILGYTVEEMTSGDLCYDALIHPDDVEQVMSEANSFLELERDTYEQVYRLRTKAGDYRWFYDYTQNIRDKQGKLIEIRGYLVDETPLKEAEIEIAKREQRAIRQRSAIAEVVLDDAFSRGQWHASYDHIARVLAQTLEADRASVWMIQDHQLRCVTLFDASTKQYRRDMVASGGWVEQYIDMLAEKKQICATDAACNPMTVMLREEYLEPSNIVSLMDTGILIGGKLRGIVSAEQVATKRQWLSEEASFAQTMASLAAQIITKTEQREAEELLRESEAQKSAIINSIKGLLVVLDEGLFFTACYHKDHPQHLFSKPDALLGKHLFESGLPENTLHIIRDGIKETIKEGATKTIEFCLGDPADQLWFGVTMSLIKRVNGYIDGVLCLFEDITNRKLHENQVTFLSLHDQLTGLYNRRFFEEELKRLDVKRNYPLSIVLVDINGLKLTNDAFGHLAGDQLIQVVANTLVKACREDEIIARIGGDEFVILLPSTELQNAGKLVRRIERLLRNDEISGLPVSAAYGCATKTNEKEKIQEIFKIAEDQMYHYKIANSQSRRYFSVQLIMKSLWEKVPGEEAHANQVSSWCKAMGEAIGLSEGEVHELATAGMLHDIGKIGINNEILDKKGPLTLQEWNSIRRHPEVSYNILSTVNEYGPMAAIILAHHERWDGEGYPRGLKGEDIPLQSRIIAIADAYDAMIHDRPFRSAMSGDTATQILHSEKGKQFDPELVDIFIKIIASQREVC